MAITAVSNLTTQNSSTTITPSLPASIAEDDFLIMSLNLKNGERVVTSGLDGWTLVEQFLTSTSSSSTAFIYTKFAGASESAPVIVLSGGSNVNVVNISSWRGVDTTTPQDVLFDSNRTGFGTSVVSPSLTTVTDDAFFLSFISLDDGANDGPATTAATGLTEIFSDMYDVGGQGYYKQQVTAGATGDITYTISGNEALAAISIALRPAAGGPSTTPDPFDLSPDITGATISTEYKKSFVLSGVDEAVTVNATGDGSVSLTENGTYGSSISSAGGTHWVKATSSASYSTETTAGISCNGVSDSFTITTEADPASDPVLTFPYPLGDESGLASAETDAPVSVCVRSTMAQVLNTTVSWGVDAIPANISSDQLTTGVEYNVAIDNGTNMATYHITAV